MARDSYKYPEERKKILEMVEDDQTIRSEGDFTRPETILEMNAIDTKNQQELRRILNKIHLPSTRNIGYDGAKGAWLIAHHCVNDISLLKTMLELIEICTKEDKDKGYYRGIPYLSDRINIQEGRKQLYGTQIWRAPNGDIVPYPIEDKNQLDKRRKKFGLEPFSEYFSSIKAEDKEQV